MYAYILCFCGRSLGDIYDIFKYLRNVKILAANNGNQIDPAFLPFTDFIEIELSDVFSSLGIDLMCCKTRLITQVEFKDIYY